MDEKKLRYDMTPLVKGKAQVRHRALFTAACLKGRQNNRGPKSTPQKKVNATSSPKGVPLAITKPPIGGKKGADSVQVAGQ